MMSHNVQEPIASDDPLKVAWDAYQQTEDFQNSKHWVMRVAPMIQSGSDEQRQAEDLMPHDQRERHVMGSLWAAFMAGYCAAQEQG